MEDRHLRLHSFSYDVQPLSPPIDGPGVRLWAGKTRTQNGQLHLPMYATWQLAEPDSAALRDVGEALVLHASGSAGGWAEAVKLIDPDKEVDEYEPNYRGNPDRWGHPMNLSTGTVSFTATLPQPQGAPTLYFHLTLLQRVSNLLALDLQSGEGRSFLEGAPHAFPNADIPPR